MIRNLYIVVLFFLTTGLLAESTENLMDYGSGTHLYSWQWHQIHNPPPAIPNIFQDSKEGMISREEFSEALLSIRLGLYSRDKAMIKDLDYVDLKKPKSDEHDVLPTKDETFLTYTSIEEGKVIQKTIKDMSIINMLSPSPNIEIDFSNVVLKYTSMSYKGVQDNGRFGRFYKETEVNIKGEVLGLFLDKSSSKPILVFGSSKTNTKERISDYEAVKKYLYQQDTTDYQGNDKGVIVMINGEVMDIFNSKPTIEKASVVYWDKKFIDIVKEATGEKNDILYRNGDHGGYELEGSRYQIGFEQGKRDAKVIASSLGTLGAVKVISHSKGGAYAVGYLAGLKEIEPKLRIAYNLMLAPHQGDDWDEFDLDGSFLNIAISHWYDWFSGNIKVYPGTKGLNIETKMMHKDYLDKDLMDVFLAPKVYKMEEVSRKYDELAFKRAKELSNKYETYNEALKKEVMETNIDFSVRVQARIGDYATESEIDCALKMTFFKQDLNHGIGSFHQEVEVALSYLQDEIDWDKLSYREVDYDELRLEVEQVEKEFYDNGHYIPIDKYQVKKDIEGNTRCESVMVSPLKSYEWNILNIYGDVDKLNKGLATYFTPVQRAYNLFRRLGRAFPKKIVSGFIEVLIKLGKRGGLHMDKNINLLNRLIENQHQLRNQFIVIKLDKEGMLEFYKKRYLIDNHMKRIDL